MDKYVFRQNPRKAYRRTAWIAVLLAFAVIMLGAYTRLSDAGLGCPDWPGCYGKLILPKTASGLAKVQATYPNIPIVVKKAWTEMAHRYIAGGLGLLILLLALWGPLRKKYIQQQPLLVPWLLVGLVILQAALGMWTVTLKLLPLIVMAHLLGGMIITALLWWLTLATNQSIQPPSQRLKVLKPWVLLGVLMVLIQITLGAWTSTNYAALACIDFPFCGGKLFPPMDWRSAFNLSSPIGPNYEGGHLAMDARIAIHMAHRYGAFLVAAYLAPLAIALVSIKTLSTLRHLGWLILFVLSCQIGLGIMNVKLTLPMWVAVAHNGVAAVLLLTMVTIAYRLFTRRGAKFT